VSRRLCRTAAALLVVCAGLFVLGATAEGDSHAETTQPAGHHEEARGAAEGETGHDEATEAGGRKAGHDGSAEERILGVDVEAPGPVVLAVAVTVALAVGLWIRKQRWLAVAAAWVAVVFALFDVTEIAHQLDESRNGLAVLAGVIAAGHLAAAATAGLSTRPSLRPTAIDRAD
jgi:hypothetical protein